MRYLEENQQYKLWTWVSFEARKSEEDKRKESYRVREESIKVLAEIESTAERFSLLQKAISKHREELETAYREDWTSMGIVPVQITKTTIKEVASGPLQLQTRLDVDVLPLDGFPIDLKVHYRCSGNPECTGHESTIIAWEYAEAFRAFRLRYGGTDEALEELKKAFDKRFLQSTEDVYALLGTHSRWPIWMIGQFYMFAKNVTPTWF